MVKSSGNIIEKTLMLGQRAKMAMMDGWENVYTGLGMNGVDKRTGGQVKYSKMAQVTVEQLHDIDDVAHRVVNLLPDEGTLKWLEHKIDGKPDLIKAITDYEDKLKVKEKFNKAWKWARLYGGSAIYVSVNDGLSPSEPLNPLRINDINALVVLHRYELNRTRLNANINDANFNLPESYAISSREGVQIPDIHHSRLIRFDGAELSSQQFINNDYWHDSVLVKLYTILRDYNAAYASASHVIQEFNIRVMKLKNLADIMGSDNTDVITQRLKIMNISKSIIGSVLLDADAESYENMSTPLTGLDSTLSKLDQRLVMATNMPHTIVLGDGAAGTLSGKGESEDKIWKAMVAKEQEKTLREPYEQFCRLMFAAKKGPTAGKEVPNHTWFFKPLWQPSEKETADTRKVVADTDAIYLNLQVVTPIDIAKSRFGGDEYSMETAIDIKALESQIETDKEHDEEIKRLTLEGQEISNQANKGALNEKA